MMQLNENEVLDVMRYLVVKNGEDLLNIYEIFLKKVKKEDSQIKKQVLTMGFFNVYSRTMLFLIDYKFDKTKTIEWIKDNGLGEKTKSGKIYKHYKFNFNTMSYENLYGYYLLQNQLRDFLLNFESDKVLDFVKSFKAPELRGNGLKKIPQSRVVELKQSATEEEIACAIEFCEEKLREYECDAEQEEALDFIGYSKTGQPLYAKQGKHYTFLEDGKTRHYGRVYGVNEDNSPKEYPEPKGYETHPHAEEEML